MNQTLKLSRLRTLLLLLLQLAAPAAASELRQLLTPLLEAHPGQSGAYVLDKGEEALLARAWLADHAAQSIDVQYFIWSFDNIGTLATESHQLGLYGLFGVADGLEMIHQKSQQSVGWKLLGGCC